ncbi:MAG: hypothetical protein ACRDF1_08700 [bacterium]
MRDIKEYLQNRAERLTRIRTDPEDLRRQGYVYSSVAEWFATHGEEMPAGAGTWTSDEVTTIKNLSERVRLRNGHCFANAQRAVFAAIASSRLELDEDLAYAEGYAWIAGHPAPFAHGWCVLNGKVWDPSLVEVTAKRVSYFGNTFPTKYLVERIFHGGNFGPLVNDWKKQWPLLKQRWESPAAPLIVTGQKPVLEPALT